MSAPFFHKEKEAVSDFLLMLEIFRFPQGIASVITLRQRRKTERTLNRSIFPEDP